MSKKKQIKAVENSAPVQDDVFIPDDIAPLCGMIITNVTDGKVTKTGLITSKEKLEKLMKLSDVTVRDGEFETMKIRGHEVIAIVNTDRVVTVRKTNNNENKKSNNPNNNKENGKMENETKVNKVETTNAAPAAEAAPDAKPEAPAAVAPEVKPELPAPTPQALADARAMGDALIAARRQIDEEHPYWKEVLKGAGIGAATAVGVIGVIAIYNWITGE